MEQPTVSAVLTWHGEMREAPTVGRKFRPNMPRMQVRDNPGLAQLMHVYGAKKQHSSKSGEYTFKFLPKKWDGFKGTVHTQINDFLSIKPDSSWWWHIHLNLTAISRLEIMIKLLKIIHRPCWEQFHLGALLFVPNYSLTALHIQGNIGSLDSFQLSILHFFWKATSPQSAFLIWKKADISVAHISETWQVTPSQQSGWINGATTCWAYLPSSWELDENVDNTLKSVC